MHFYVRAETIMSAKFGLLPRGSFVLFVVLADQSVRRIAILSLLFWTPEALNGAVDSQ